MLLQVVYNNIEQLEKIEEEKLKMKKQNITL